MKKSVFAICLLLLTLFSFAQDTGKNSEIMANTMRSNGKIYVVVAVLLTILLGLIGYLISIDRKISKLEKED